MVTPHTTSLPQSKLQGTITLALPPHLTHHLQPLDLSIFGPPKTYTGPGMSSNILEVVTKYQLCLLFSEVWYQAVRPQNVISGFCMAGIFPFNRHVQYGTIIQYSFL